MTGKWKVASAVSGLAVPGSDNVWNALDEYMKAKEMTPEQLKEVLRLRKRLDKVFSDGEERVTKAIDERKQSETVKKLTLMLTMHELASIRRDYDELDCVQGSRLPSQRRHFKDLLTIYKRLGKLFKRILAADLQFIRGWEEKYEVETKTIKLAMKNAVKNANEEFLGSTVWQESKMELEPKTKTDIQKHITELQKEDKKENDQAKRCENDQAKRVAVRELRNLARQSHSSREFIAEQKAIELLVNLLKNGTPFVKQDAACALGNLAFGNDENGTAIMSNGGIELLSGLLDGTEAQPECAAYALGRIVNSITIDKIVCQNDLFERLVDLLSGETSQQRWSAAFALGRISKQSKHVSEQSEDVPEQSDDVSKQSKNGCAEIVRCGGIPLFIGLLQKGEPLEIAYAAQALGHLAADNSQIAFDVIPAISNLVQMLTGEDSLQVEFAAYALSQLASNRVCGSRIDSMDAIPPLVLLLDGSDNQRIHAVCTLARLAEHCVESCKKIAEAGGIGPLSGLLHKPEDEQRLSTKALGCIAQINEATRREIIRHGVIDRFFGFLEIEALKKPAALALSNIAILLDDWGQSDTKKNVDTVIDLLNHGDEDMKEYAAAILRPLCSGDHDVSPVRNSLLAMIEGGSERQKTNASAVLAMISRFCANHQGMVRDKFVPPCVKLLSSWSDAQKDNALFVISKIASNPMITVATDMANAQVVMPLRTLIIDGSEKQVATAVLVLSCLLSNDDDFVIYKAIAKELGTYNALQQLRANGTAQQQELASRVITLLDSRQEAKCKYYEQKWDYENGEGPNPDDRDAGDKAQEVYEDMISDGFLPLWL